MSKKLRKALGAVKDQTSISLAKVGNAANLEVVVLKATTHDEIPMDDRYVNEILQMVSSNKVYAAACAQAIGKRITKTKDWVVALKSLMIVLRIFQDGDPYFPREVLHLMKRGVKILNLNNFRDDSSSRPWDYTAFVRRFALYLDERLDCFVSGKLQRRFHCHENDYRNQSKMQKAKLADEPGTKDAKPSMLLDRISYWQRLLDRVMGTMPTGEARINRLIQISFYAVVQESFDLYRDISNGLTLLLDSFFQLQYESSVATFQACVKSSNQFDELSSFYDLCKNIGVGRTSEYPCVQKVSEELIETLQYFLKDQANSLSSQNGSYRSPVNNKHLVPSGMQKSKGSSLRQNGNYEQSERSVSSSNSFTCDASEELMFSEEADGASSCRSTDDYSDNSEQSNEKQFEYEDCSSSPSLSAFSQQSSTTNQAPTSGIDLVFFDDWVPGQSEKPREQQQQYGQRDCWDLALAEAATRAEEPFQKDPILVDPFGIDNSSVLTSTSYTKSYNPFLEDLDPVIPTPPVTTINTFNQAASLPDFFSFSPSYEYESPTFQAKSPLGTTIMSSPPPPPPPTLVARGFSHNSMSTTSSAQSLDLTSPNQSFSCHNCVLGILPPTFVAVNGNEKIVAPSFCAGSFDEIIARPTFSARSVEETTATFSADKCNQICSSEFGSDPFVTGPSTVTSQQQQLMWMEQQNKIIAKRLAL